MMVKTCSILVGRQSICNYLKISKNEFYEFIDAGMPIKKIGKKRKRWIAHCDQLNDWVREIVRQDPAN